MGTKADVLAFAGSCLNKAKNNEPIFVLCGSDSLAPEVIRFWAKLLAERSNTAKSRQKMLEALSDASLFEGYAAEYGSHIPGTDYEKAPRP